MPPRKIGSKTAQKHEMEAFAERYDTFALLYGDPVEVAFAVMARSFNPGRDPKTNELLRPNDELAKATADMLMSYRFPRVKASEVMKPNGQPMQFTVVMQQNAALPPVEVKAPVRPALLVKAEKSDE